jgi:ribosomal protein S6
MMFDTSPLLLKRLNAAMRRDPQVIRWTFLKKGDGL